MPTFEHTQTLNDFRQRATETLDRLNETGEAEILTVDGQARAVILSPASYDEMARDAQAEAHRRAWQQYEAGEGQELNVAMDEIRAELLAMKAAQANGSAKRCVTP